MVAQRGIALQGVVLLSYYMSIATICRPLRQVRWKVRVHRVVALPPLEAGALSRRATHTRSYCPPQEMLRTLKEQVQQRDAVIADLRRQLALVTSAAAAHGVQLQQLPGRGGAG